MYSGEVRNVCSFMGDFITPSVLSSVFSCIATCGLCYIAYQTYAYTKREDEMKYARSVALWIIGQDFDNKNFMDVAIINLSESPIYDVYVIGCPYGKDEDRKKSYGGYSQRDVIPPNVNGSNKVYMSVEVLGLQKDLSSVTATMFFRDINEIEWCRDSHGRLHKCPDYQRLFKSGLKES